MLEQPCYCVFFLGIVFNDKRGREKIVKQIVIVVKKCVVVVKQTSFSSKEKNNTINGMAKFETVLFLFFGLEIIMIIMTFYLFMDELWWKHFRHLFNHLSHLYHTLSPHPPPSSKVSLTYRHYF